MQPQGQQAESWVLFETDANKNNAIRVPPSAENRKWEIVWMNVILIPLIHLGGLYGGYIFLFKAMWSTSLFALILYVCTGLGVTAGAHRLWAHKSYKARLPLRLILIVFNTMAFQESVLKWVRNHRMHHKYSETDADPHNATRGFFFSHVGWLLVRKHPLIKAKGKNIDLSDLEADPVLRFQKKYYLLLMLLCCFILPTYIPTLWGESAWNAFYVCGIFRYVFVLNIAWFINSVGHLWGSKPYDRHISPVDLKSIAILLLGESFHNYHHTFPWDYKTAELGNSSLNFTKLFIDTMARIGWAYDLKTVSQDVVEKRVKRTGDGSFNCWSLDD